MPKMNRGIAKRKEKRTKYTLEQLKEKGGKVLKDKNIFVCEDSKIFENIGDAWVQCMEQRVKNKKYRTVCLNQKIFYVHKLYAEAFLPPLNEENEKIVFKDGNPLNVNKDNLVYATQSELQTLNHRNNWKDKEYLEKNGYTSVFDDAYFINTDGKCYSRNENMFYTNKRGAKPKRMIPSYDNDGNPVLVNIYLIYATAFIPNPKHYKNVMFSKENSEDFKDLVWTAGSGRMCSPSKMDEVRKAYAGYERLDLDEKTKNLIKGRLEGLSYAKIGQQYGYTRQYVHQTLKQVRITLGTECEQKKKG